MSRRTTKEEKQATGDDGNGVVKYGRHRGARRSRLDATAWVDAGIRMLVRQDIEHVGVESLARDLGVTKGSFYWHFKDRADLHDAILECWYQRATVGVWERAQREAATPSDRLMRLLELPFWSPKASDAADLELAIRAWSRRSEKVRRAVQKVDKMRLQHLAELFSALGFGKQEATARAHLSYALMEYLSQARELTKAETMRVIRAAHTRLLSG